MLVCVKNYRDPFETLTACVSSCKNIFEFLALKAEVIKVLSGEGEGGPGIQSRVCDLSDTAGATRATIGVPELAATARAWAIAAPAYLG